MTHTWNEPDRDQRSDSSKQAGQPGATVADAAARECARRRWTFHQIGHRRRASVALDQWCEPEIPKPSVVQIDYSSMGFDLGMPERRTAGLAILDRERAA